MSSPDLLTSRRIYVLVKRDIERGQFASGDQIPLAELARALGTSVQPVRDVLARLVGERILSLHPRAGFQVPHLSVRQVRDLIDWHAHLLRLVLRERRRDWTMKDMTEMLAGLDARNPAVVAEAAARLFDNIADCSENIEHVEAMRSANARLHPIWLRDSTLTISVRELQMIAAATLDGRQSAIKSAIWAYQRRQRRGLKYAYPTG